MIAERCRKLLGALVHSLPCIDPCYSLDGKLTSIRSKYNILAGFWTVVSLYHLLWYIKPIIIFLLCCSFAVAFYGSTTPPRLVALIAQVRENYYFHHHNCISFLMCALLNDYSHVILKTQTGWNREWWWSSGATRDEHDISSVF